MLGEMGVVSPVNKRGSAGGAGWPKSAKRKNNSEMRQ